MTPDTRIVCTGYAGKCTMAARVCAQRQLSRTRVRNAGRYNKQSDRVREDRGPCQSGKCETGNHVLTQLRAGGHVVAATVTIPSSFGPAISVRQCVVCRAPLAPREKERLRAFWLRKTCSQACANSIRDAAKKTERGE